MEEHLWRVQDFHRMVAISDSEKGDFRGTL